MKPLTLFSALTYASSSYAVYCCLPVAAEIQNQLMCTDGAQSQCCSKNSYKSCGNRGTFQHQWHRASYSDISCIGGGVLACVV
ncbi:unnamed protein product [Cercospora beticola]|nr:unnamed protein product [Cercospora beticola]